MTEPIRLGFALTGSFCTFARVLSVLEGLGQSGRYEITPILSYNAAQMDTRFGSAAEVRARLEAIAGRPVIDTIQAAEPIGPKGLLDVLVIAPCTGNTLAKLTHSVIDTPVTMAAKSHLRRDRPLCARRIDKRWALRLRVQHRRTAQPAALLFRAVWTGCAACQAAFAGCRHGAHSADGRSRPARPSQLQPILFAPS